MLYNYYLFLLTCIIMFHKFLEHIVIHILIFVDYHLTCHKILLNIICFFLYSIFVFSDTQPSALCLYFFPPFPGNSSDLASFHLFKFVIDKLCEFNRIQMFLGELFLNWAKHRRIKKRSTHTPTHIAPWKIVGVFYIFQRTY